MEPIAHKAPSQNPFLTEILPTQKVIKWPISKEPPLALLLWELSVSTETSAGASTAGLLIKLAHTKNLPAHEQRQMQTHLWWDSLFLWAIWEGSSLEGNHLFKNHICCPHPPNTWFQNQKYYHRSHTSFQIKPCKSRAIPESILSTLLPKTDHYLNST